VSITLYIKHNSDRQKLTSALLVATVKPSRDGQCGRQLSPLLMSAWATDVEAARHYYDVWLL
jgi:hypothetical protein